MMRYLALFLSLSLFAADAIEEKYYSMDELEALEVKKNYTELMLALPHVIPAEKGNGWEELVERAAIGQMKEIYGKKDPGAILRAKALGKQFPSLARAKKFQKAKREGTVEILRNCYENNSDKNSCTETAGYVFNTEADDIPLYEALAPAVERGAGKAAVFKVYGRAIHVGNRDTLCQSKGLKGALMAAMETGKPADVRSATDFIASSCWVVLEREIYARLERMPASSPAKKNWCALVAKKKGQSSACR